MATKRLKQMKVCVLQCLTAVIVCLSPFQGFAATWYVRTDGGTITQCTGQTDAAYPGTGINQACAVNHLFWLLSPKDQTMVIAGGDTVIIGPGSYMMGINQTGDQAPNTGTGSCSSGNSTFSCMMPPIPSGPDAAHPTTIIGKNWDTQTTPPPELWGAGRIAHIIDLSNSNNIVLQYLDITDHAQCGYNMQGSSMMCNRTLAPYGYQADYGIYAKDSSNVLLKDINLHGLAQGGVWGGRLTDWTFDTVNIIANAYDGFNGDLGTHGAFNSGTDTSMYGTITIKNSKINYNGCVENYPLTGVYPDVATASCHGQTLYGYGDGIGMYYNDANWVIQDTEIMHNTQDGLDNLYHVGQNGTVTISRVRAEGNSGQQIKVGASFNMDNSVVIGDCSFYYNNPLAEAPFTADNCRAGSTAIIAAGWRPGHNVTITNSTILASNYNLIEVGSNRSFSATTGGVAGSIANVTAMNSYAVNQASDTMWVWWPGGYNPNLGQIIPIWNNYTQKVVLTGTWISDGNGIYHLTGIGAQTGGNYSFNSVTWAYSCDGTEKLVSRNNIFIGMGPWAGSTSSINTNKTTNLVYLDGNDGNSNGPCAAVNPVIMDNKDSIVDNLVAGTNQPSLNAGCPSTNPNANDIICLSSSASTYLPVLNGVSLNAYPDLYTLGENWDVIPTVGSLSIGKSSSAVGTVVLGSTTVPSLDMLGGARPSGSGIDWGAYAYRPDYTPPVISMNQVVSPTNIFTQNLGGTVSAQNGVSSVTVQLNSQNPQPAVFNGGMWSYTVSGLTIGNNTVIVSVQDSYGNNASVEATIQVIDNVPPIVTAFSIPGSYNNLAVPVTTFTATDNVAVTGYMISENSTPPAPGATGWTASFPASYIAAAAGSYTLYPWARDAAGNVSAVYASPQKVVIDLTPPVVTGFAMPAASASLTVPLTAFTAADNVGVTGYLVSQSSATPSAGASGWSCSAPKSITFSTSGSQTAYAWAKDAAGNVSARVSAGTVITLSTAPNVTINYSGAGSRIGSSVNISASATDNVKVVQMTLFIDGVQQTQVNGGEMNWTWDTTTVAQGAHVIKVTAKNSANISSSKSLTVIK